MFAGESGSLIASLDGADVRFPPEVSILLVLRCSWYGKGTMEALEMNQPRPITHTVGCKK